MRKLTEAELDGGTNILELAFRLLHAGGSYNLIDAVDQVIKAQETIAKHVLELSDEG